MQPTGPQHYRAYQPKPLTRQDIEQLEILFGGLHWRAERLIQATLENRGYKARPLPRQTGPIFCLGASLPTSASVVPQASQQEISQTSCARKQTPAVRKTSRANSPISQQARAGPAALASITRATSWHSVI